MTEEEREKYLDDLIDKKNNLGKELFRLIENETKLLTGIEDNLYRRELRFTENKEVLDKLKMLIEEFEVIDKILHEETGKDLKKFFYDDDETEESEYKMRKRNFPIIIENAENVVINRLKASRSFKITKDYKKDIILGSIFKFKQVFGSDYEEVKRQHNLTEVDEKICITAKDLLEWTGTEEVQARKDTGFQYILNIRKIGERRSKRYKYGLMIFDRIPAITNANKESPRTHSLDKLCECFNAKVIDEIDLQKEVFKIYIKS